MFENQADFDLNKNEVINDQFIKQFMNQQKLVI
jgi:hypothetical protein